VPMARPTSTLLPLSEVYMNLITGYQNTPSCVLMEKAVRTFDNVTYDLPETNCQVLLAMDCSAQQKWAVYATELDDKADTKKVTVLTGGKEVKLMPPQQQDLMQIQVDGKIHELSFDKPVSFCSAKDCIRIFLRKTVSDAVNPIAVIENPDEKLTVLYDGKNAKVLLGNGYAGKTCGLCGDNDDESDDEFVGPDLCIYDQAEDFVNSYTMAGEHCEETPQPKGKVRCPKSQDNRQKDEQNHAHQQTIVQVRRNPIGKTTVVHQKTEIPAQSVNQQQQQQINACQGLRTEYLIRGDMACFTTRPVLTCGSSCVAQSSRQVTLDFHCLQKASPFTQQLMSEAQRSVLTKLANKRVDLRETVSVPLACLAA